MPKRRVLPGQNSAPAGESASLSEQSAADSPVPSPTENGPQLVIEKLAIDVPITWDVDGYNEKAYLAALAGGVAHFRGTAKPGSAAGNIFIFGHSGYTKALPNDYHKIFRTLDKLDKGDEIEIRDGDQTHHYRVTAEREVAADNLSVLEPTPTETLTLMTCWPPGTLKKRLIIQAEVVP